MKFLTLLICLVLYSCMVKAGGFDDKGFKDAVAFGDVWELNVLSLDVDKQLYLRLYRSPVFEEDCFVEAHGACWYRYFLSVAYKDVGTSRSHGCE